MFGLLSPSGKKLARSRPTAWLFLERLESRDTPSTLSLSVTQGIGSNITLSGELSNASTLANVPISVTGVASGTAYTNSNGAYTISLPDTGGSGTLYAQTQDGLSNLASAPVNSSSSPTLTLSISSYGPGKEVTLTGTLTGESNNAGQTINITGVASGTATTDSNGNYTVTLPASSLGTASAQTADGKSNIPSVPLTDQAPDIYDYGGVEGPGNVWTFSGTVSWNESWDSMSGQIEGPPKIGTVTITATSDGEMNNGECTGTFSIAIQLDGTQATNGNYLATVTDCWGTVSNQVTYYVSQSGT